MAMASSLIKRVFYNWQNSCSSQMVSIMKKSIFILVITVACACGNQSAENQPTDLDRTKNNDTSAVPADTSQIIKKDSTDSTHS